MDFWRKVMAYVRELTSDGVAVGLASDGSQLSIDVTCVKYWIYLAPFYA